jgi:hypothetical protein
MELDAETQHILNDIASRADHVGHVLLEPAETDFAASAEGARWLEPIDVARRLYKLTPAARQQVAL